jgi:hypothetical protein
MVLGQIVGKYGDHIHAVGVRNGEDTASYLKGLCEAFDGRVVVPRATVVSF